MSIKTNFQIGIMQSKEIRLDDEQARVCIAFIEESRLIVITVIRLEI
jgi:hypothetical protein